MTNGAQVWVLAAAIGLPFLLAHISKTNREIETKERLEECFSEHPQWAARYYSKSTPSEEREGIFYSCQPGHAAAEDLGDD
jgi:hypothetical protein